MEGRKTGRDCCGWEGRRGGSLLRSSKGTEFRKEASRLTPVEQVGESLNEKPLKKQSRTNGFCPHLPSFPHNPSSAPSGRDVPLEWIMKGSMHQYSFEHANECEEPEGDRCTKEREVAFSSRRSSTLPQSSAERATYLRKVGKREKLTKAISITSQLNWERVRKRNQL